MLGSWLIASLLLIAGPAWAQITPAQCLQMQQGGISIGCANVINCDGATILCTNTGGNVSITAPGGTGGGAPVTASYWTRVAEAGLSNETALGPLATGLILNTTTTGVPTIYPGSTPCGAGQFVTALSASGVATCGTPTGGSGNVTAAGTLTLNQIVLGQGTTAVATLGTLGTSATVLHGNAAGAPTFAAVVSADLNITATACTNQVVTAISSGAVGTCSTVANAMLANSSITVTGTANRVTVTGSPVALGGTVTLSGPQDIHTGASPTFAGLTLSGLAGSGTRCVQTDASGLFSSTGSACGSGGGGAPADATYWTSTANGTLTNEVNLGALTTALLLNTVSAGTATPSAYAGTGACAAGNFISALSASGVATCGTPSGSGNVSAAGTLTLNQLVLGQGTTAVATLGSLGTTTTVLHGNASGAPSFGAVALATDVSGTLQAAQFPALTGDVTTSAGSLATTIATSAVTFAKMQNLSAGVLMGRTSASTGAPQEITVGTGLTLSGTTLTAATGDFSTNTATSIDGEVVLFSGTTGKLGKRSTGTGVTRITSGVQSATELSGDVTTSGSNAVTIANDAVTYAKMQNVSAASKLLGRGSAGGSGDPEEITLGTNLSMSGTTLNATGGGGLTETLVVVTSDVTHASSDTTLSNVTGLSLSVSASSTEMWALYCLVLATSNGAVADFKFGWSFPTGTVVGFLDLPSSGNAVGVTPGDAFGATVSDGGRVGTTVISLNGTIFVGGTAGTVQLQFAQNSISANTTIASKGSWCRFSRLST